MSAIYHLSIPIQISYLYFLLLNSSRQARIQWDPEIFSRRLVDRKSYTPSEKGILMEYYKPDHRKDSCQFGNSVTIVCQNYGTLTRLPSLSLQS